MGTLKTERLDDFFPPRGCMIFFVPRVYWIFFPKRSCIIFFVPRGCKFPSSQFTKFPSSQDPMIPRSQDPKIPSSQVPRFLDGHNIRYWVRMRGFFLLWSKAPQYLVEDDVEEESIGFNHRYLLVLHNPESDGAKDGVKLGFYHIPHDHLP